MGRVLEQNVCFLKTQQQQSIPFNLEWPNKFNYKCLGGGKNKYTSKEEKLYNPFKLPF